MTYQKLSDIDRIERVWEQGRIEVWRRSDGIWGVSLLPDEGKRGYPGVTYAPGPDAPPGFPQEYNPDVLLTWARENWQATDTSLAFFRHRVQPGRPLDSPAPMPSDQSPIRAELDRVGASFRKAGAANYITVTEYEDGVHLVGPPREHPRRSWKGPHWQLLELLAALPDGAGVEVVWRALS
jgi:hypothetical protein